MSELTKEYFDQQLSTVNAKMDSLASKQDLSSQTEELKAYVREQTEELGRMVNSGFEGERRYLEGRFQELVNLVDVREKVQKIEQTIELKFSKLEDALHIKL
jgi:predicted site-specific integrase-resolvase